ncbi:MAG: hypothetical protein AUJ48_02550 [Deltaproteobacteria bacterium CG1_02_45_11]|nr:MAG: hypothetical protein AUJ48_02550 [Deltaproteobacteria bacterium CG1_02_45_11]
MELDFKKKEKIVGTFIVGILILLLTTVIIIGRGKDWFKTYVTYYTTFNESYNLPEDAAVKLYDAGIGKVKKITLVGDKVKVELVILEEYASRIRSDSIAVVKSPTFIGSEYVSIKPGSASADLIPEGGEIPSMEKKSIDDVLAEFEVQKTARMVVKAVQDLSEIAQIMRDPQGPFFTALDNINKTLSHFEKIIRGVQDGEGTVGGILKSKVLFEDILENINKIGGILENISKASDKTPETMAQVTESVTRLKNILQEVDENIDAFKIILNNMEESSYDIPEITQSTREGISEIRDGVENVNKVFKSLQKNILIRSNIPPEPSGVNIDAGLRQ